MSAGTLWALYLRLLREGIPQTELASTAMERGWITRDPFGDLMDEGSRQHFSVTPQGAAAAEEVTA